MSYWNINKPDQKGKWLIWPKTILNNLANADCNDTIEGICYDNKTIDECIAECKGECAAGYHIQFDNGNTICVPIRTARHPDLNPVYRLVDQELYDLDGVNISTFVNNELFDFPPNRANVVFYKDIITLLLSDSSKGIGKETKDISNNSPIYMNKNVDINIQLLHSKELGSLSMHHLPVRYGHPVIISIPGTALIAIKNGVKPELIWKQLSIDTKEITEGIFEILPVNTNKNRGDMLFYGDEFKLVYNEIYTINLNQNNRLVAMDGEGTKFIFQSKMNGYYCKNDDVCHSVPIQKMTINGEKGTYTNDQGKTVDVYRHEGCFGLCDSLERNDSQNVGLFSIKNIDNKENSNMIIVIIIISIIIIIIATIIFNPLKFVRS